MAKTKPALDDQVLIAGDINALALSTNIDRRTCHRVVPLKVIALGVSRTGTSSLRQALLDLGYKDCYHYASCLQENPPDQTLWTQAWNAKFLGIGTPFTRKDWDQLLGHCQAITDTPCVTFYRELLDAYPEAKVILTIRDSADQWFESQMGTIVPYAEATVGPDLSSSPPSFLSTLLAALFSPLTNLIHTIFPPLIPPRLHTFLTAQMTLTPMFRLLLSDRRNNTQLSKAWYEAYNDEIRALVPADNLLVMNVKEGWRPLCEFLGHEVPGYAFPRRNDMAAFQRNTEVLGGVMEEARRRNLMRGVGIGVLGIGIGVGIWMGEGVSWGCLGGEMAREGRLVGIGKGVAFCW